MSNALQTRPFPQIQKNALLNPPLLSLQPPAPFTISSPSTLSFIPICITHLHLHHNTNTAQRPTNPNISSPISPCTNLNTKPPMHNAQLRAFHPAARGRGICSGSSLGRVEARYTCVFCGGIFSQVRGRDMGGGLWSERVERFVIGALRVSWLW